MSWLDWIFPPVCINCRRQGWWLCPRCLPHVCWTGEYNQFQLISPEVSAWSATEYIDVSELLVKAVKYDFYQVYAPVIAQLMLIRFPDWAAEHAIDCLVPIPLHPRRLRWRGFNQSELIAQSLSRIWQVPVVSTALVRTSYHQHQAGKNREERQLVTHDFALINDQLAERNVCLIDDVITTGATVRSAVSAVEKSADRRPKNITALTFARA